MNRHSPQQPKAESNSLDTTFNTPNAKSYFARKLESDPELARRCEEVVRSIRAAASEDIAAGIRSEQLTAEDLGVVINARAEDLFRS